MSIASAREFNRSPSSVKAKAKRGPVIVTDRGRPSIVVLDIDEYDRLTGSNLRESRRMDVDVEFEPVQAREHGRIADL